MAAGLSRAIDLIGEHGFVYGQSEAIRSVNSIVGEIAQTDIPVLLSGESGTGKDVYGKLIHQLSRRRELPMAKLNCTMLAPGDLLNRMRQCLEQAQEGSAGTLFLDGIDELDVDCPESNAGDAAATGSSVGRASEPAADLDRHKSFGSRDRNGAVP
jgi:transcriptional regulator of acetoin/glycerol metabolism